MLKHGILGLLNYGNMTGYDIKTVFNDSLRHFWQAQTSQIYRELRVLEKNGWIKATHVEQESRPDKNILSITEEGKKELMRWLEEDSAASPIRNPMLMKTFFRGECSREENIQYFQKLQEKETVFPEGSENTDRKRQEYGNNIDNPVRALYWKFTSDFGLMYDKMLREWCMHCIKELEVLKNENITD
ncbi:MAG: PadR family transcriptional regulator [Treponemataceae bacterium]|nr:PadR family transcriptional regulator [Treponemataceae bacterium]